MGSRQVRGHLGQAMGLDYNSATCLSPGVHTLQKHSPQRFEGERMQLKQKKVLRPQDTFQMYLGAPRIYWHFKKAPKHI